MANVEFDPSQIAIAHDATPESNAPPPIEKIIADLIVIIRSHTNQTATEWDAATTIQETGIDSFDFVELVFEVEDKYAIDLNFNANSAENLRTVSDVAQLIQSRLLAKERP